MRLGTEDRTVIPSSAESSEGAGNNRSSDRGEPGPHRDPSMTVDHFNALDTAGDLEAAGIERPHAEAIARAVGRAVAPLATKADIRRLETTLRGALEQHRDSTKTDSERLETTLRGALEQHRDSTKTDSERLETTLKGALEQHRDSTRADSERLETTLRGDFERRMDRHEAWTMTELSNLRADMYRALWIQGAGIVAIVAALNLLP